MSTRSPEAKAIEKKMKEDAKIAREAARRERASQVVAGASYINGFRVMDSDAEILLQIALDNYDNSESCWVTISHDMVPEHLSNSLSFQAEKLQQYGTIVGYMTYGGGVMITLSTAGKEYFKDKENAKAGEHRTEAEIKKTMILVSHASADAKYVERIITLFENIGLGQDQVVCSSVPGYGIPLDNDIYEWLANKFVDMDLHVVFILSDRYYSSVPCLNEMGAAWVTKKAYTSILLPGFEFSKIRGAINPYKMAISLDSNEEELKQRLNELKDSFMEKFGLNKVPDIRWEHFRSAFIDSIKGIKVEQKEKKIRTDQPSFAVKISAINKQLPGTVDVLNKNLSSVTKHRNIQISLEIINDKPARNLIIFDKLITTALKPGEKYHMVVAYEDSEDVSKWPSRVTKILHSEYDDTEGFPNWFNICYQDEGGHNMIQSVKLQSYDGEKYYDLDGYPWEVCPMV